MLIAHAEMASTRFSVEAMVHGYHVYENIWESVLR